MCVCDGGADDNGEGTYCCRRRWCHRVLSFDVDGDVTAWSGDEYGVWDDEGVKGVKDWCYYWCWCWLRHVRVIVVVLAMVLVVAVVVVMLVIEVVYEVTERW